MSRIEIVKRCGAALVLYVVYLSVSVAAAEDRYEAAFHATYVFICALAMLSAFWYRAKRKAKKKDESRENGDN